jgi:hypothetical protein
VGAADYLCADFRLPVPEWVHDPAYTMPELWEPDDWMYPEDPEFRERRRLKADPTFLKHNVLYDSRSLIAL